MMRIRFHREARTSPEVIDGLKVPYGPAKRNAPKWRWRLILLAVLSPAIFLAYNSLHGLLTLSANGTVFLAQDIVRAPAQGSVAELVVDLGAEVHRGDVLVRLQDVELDAAIADVDARGAGTTRRSTAGEQRFLVAELGLRERTLRSHEERAATIERLVRERAATIAELREARVAVDQAQATVLRLQKEFAETAPLANAPALLDSASGRERERLVARRGRLIVRAPADGRVLDLLAMQGEFVNAGDPLLLTGRAKDPQVIAYVSPQIAPRLTLGSRATIHFPDGTKAQAVVAEQPMLTRRMPADLVDQFGVRPMTVVLHLQADQAWPSAQRVHGLPITVRFHYGWEPRGSSRKE